MQCFTRNFAAAAHAQEVEQMSLNGWSARTGPMPNGVTLAVTSSDPKELQRIRGLGFIGVLASGSHHQPHHLTVAKGEFPLGRCLARSPR